MKLNTKKNSEKFELKKKFETFKRLFWVFGGVLLFANIALFYFIDGIIYFITLIVGNIVLVWILIPVFIWIGKTYLLEAGLEIVETAKEEVKDFTKYQVIDATKNNSVSNLQEISISGEKSKEI